MNLKVVGGVDTDDEYEMVDVLTCPRCGADHYLIQCRHLKKIEWEDDEFSRWTTAEFFKHPAKPPMKELVKLMLIR